MFGLVASLTALLMSHRRAYLLLQNLAAEIDVDTEWVQFIEIRNALFRNAFNRLAATTMDEETRKYCLSTSLETDRYQRN